MRAEERAIVQRMSNENTEVKSFFTRYQAANAMPKATFDGLGLLGLAALPGKRTRR
jgi:hypothetical protein